MREYFFTCLDATTRFRQAALDGKPSNLVAYHAHHKLMFLGLKQASMRRLGRIVASRERQPFGELLAVYRKEMATIFSA